MYNSFYLTIIKNKIKNNIISYLLKLYINKLGDKHKMNMKRIKSTRVQEQQAIQRQIQGRGRN